MNNRCVMYIHLYCMTLTSLVRLPLIVGNMPDLAKVLRRGAPPSGQLDSSVSVSAAITAAALFETVVISCFSLGSELESGGRRSVT
jgi:hypothetical protein